MKGEDYDAEDERYLSPIFSALSDRHSREERLRQASAPEKVASLRDEIAEAINRHSREGLSNTPDFILAEYLIGCLKAFEIATASREDWYGYALRIGGPVRADG